MTQRQVEYGLLSPLFFVRRNIIQWLFTMNYERGGPAQ